MITIKEFKEREFSDKEEAFKALVENKKDLIALKRSDKTNSDSLIVSINKSLINDKSLALRDGYFYPVINTTNYFDSHNDVHIKGIWNKSVNEQQGKIYYLADHKKEVASIIAYPQDVEITLRDLTWKQLGFDFDGSTQALIYIIKKDKIRLAQVKEIIAENIQMQNSVSMEYVNIDLAVDSKSPDFIEEKKVFDKYYASIANQKDVDVNGYFWAVTEAKIKTEGSMVLFGSNPATPILQSKSEPPLGTLINEPPLGTRKNINKILLIN